MKEYIFICREIWKGHTILRAFLNLRLTNETLRGQVIDIGGGRSADYIRFMPRSADANIKTFDIKSGESVNFESDTLPAKDSTYDTVLFLNVMEHIYNHKHITKEVYRIANENGLVIGFVPFLMWYHADPSDYFRYTHEALAKIFSSVKINSYEIEPISRGPFTAAGHLLLMPFPRVVRIFLYTPLHTLDIIFRLLKPNLADRYALGYFFKLKKQPIKSNTL